MISKSINGIVKLLVSALCVSLCFISGVFSQDQIGMDTIPDTDTISQNKLGLGAEVFTYSLATNGTEYDTLIGDVKITQDSFFLFCDRAYVRDKSEVEAIDNVSILHGDSIEIFADSLVFSDRAKITDLYGEVIFVKNERKLYTTSARYNINSKSAYYEKGATLYNAGTTLISDKGIYDIDGNKAKFEGRVTVEDSTSILRTDSMKYNLATETIYIISGTNITTDSSQIYCEGGYFDYKSEFGRFYNNLQIQTGDRTILADKVDYYSKLNKYVLTGYPVVNGDKSHAQADTIIYYDDTEMVELIGRAFYRDESNELRAYRIDYNLENDTYETIGSSEVKGDDGKVLKADRLYSEDDGDNVAEFNVHLVDEKESTTLHSDKLVTNDKNGEYQAYNVKGQPLLVKSFDEDSLFLKCDTLLYTNNDTIETYYGRNNVNYLKGDMSGRADDLYYNPGDSVYVFHGDPILWTDSTQVSGDTVIIEIANDALNSMQVIGNSFMIMQDADGTFNQVKGDKMINHFVENEIVSTEVSGNVEMVYFRYENGKLEGVNHSLCGALTFYFAEGELTNLNFKEKPKSTFTKGEVDVESYNLEGFTWSIRKRPTKKGFEK